MDCEKKWKIKTVVALRGGLGKKCKIKRVGHEGADCKKSAKLRGLGH